ncbi:hypothetical protein ACPDHD_00395 [Myroides odoratimimus]|uniref:hypothetical protein n=1 Tax=Myroides odoratimimus TaxID=76832 RepID=UPI003D2F1654
MEEKIYKILWIDDEHEALTGTKGRAKHNGIILVPFKSLEGGMAELERNSALYDGVLLDAKFLEEENDEAGTEDTDNVHRAKERIFGLQKKFEVFVLTGQAEAYEDQTFGKAFKNVYKKGVDSDVEALFIAIKAAADKQEDTQIKHHYSPLFNKIKKGSFLEKHESSLIEILRNIEVGSDFNTIRKVLESLFLKLSELSIIPNGFTEEKGWITGTSLFLSAKHSDYEFISQIIHPTVSELLYRLLNIVQDASHSEGNLKLKVDEFIKIQPTGYLYKSTVYNFLELLVYFSILIEENQDIECNQARWIKKKGIAEDWRSGHIEQIAENRWGTFVCFENGQEVKISVHPLTIENYKLVENKDIKVRVEPSPDKTKLHIKEVKII